MSTRKAAAPVHSAWTTPDGLTPCCGEDPRTVGELTLDRVAVTCPAATAPVEVDPPAPPVMDVAASVARG